MKTAHTPAPWSKDEQGDANGNFTIRPDDGSTNGDIHAEVIATVYTEEDARLIAAAPELLEVLKYVLPILEDNNLTFGDDFAKEAFNRAEQAITKATQP